MSDDLGPTGPWLKQTGYLGVRFGEGAVHCGWIKLEVAVNEGVANVLDCAYELRTNPSWPGWLV